MTRIPAAADRRRLRFLRAVMVSAAVAGVLLVYGGSVVVRTIGLYDYVKSDGPGWRGHVLTADPELGLAPVPGATGAQILPLGPELPVRFDDNGFRVPVDDRDTLAGDGPLLMSLGCSFTYGAGVRATDTYVYLAADSLGGRALNAGVCSYGAAQMELLAGRLVPEYRPDYLVVQLSPWLVARSMTPFAPSYAGMLPAPWFYESDSVLLLHPPVFESGSLDLDLWRYRGTGRSLPDFLSFLWNVGIPMYAHDDFAMAVYGIRRLTGGLPSPSEDAGRIVERVYGDIAGVCEASGTVLIVLVLGRTCDPVDIPWNRLPEDAIVVDAHRAMLDSLAVRSPEEYDRAYAIWRGDPPVLVDRHPNERAHRIIAGALVSAVLSDGARTPPDM